MKKTNWFSFCIPPRSHWTNSIFFSQSSIMTHFFMKRQYTSSDLTTNSPSFFRNISNISPKNTIFSLFSSTFTINMQLWFLVFALSYLTIWKTQEIHNQSSLLWAKLQNAVFYISHNATWQCLSSDLTKLLPEQQETELFYELCSFLPWQLHRLRHVKSTERSFKLPTDMRQNITFQICAHQMVAVTQG